jgi:hypothetical protein
VDALIDDVAELDGPLLAAMWTRAVLAGDADLIAVWEAECAARGVRAQSLVAAARRPLVAAKAKKDDDEPTHIDPGKRSGGPRSYAEITAQSQKNIREGKSYDTGQATYKDSKGYNPYRKKKGEKGGGQFTTKEGAQTTDPNVARTPLEEDDPSIPDKSPKGAEIEDFRDGMMIYKDGTRYDGEGWRDSKGRALDSKGNVIKKTGGGKGGGSGTSAVEREKEKAKKAAEKAKKDQERQESRDWDTAESRRKADAAAKEGNYASLLSIVERNETAARKARDFAKSPEAREKAELEVARAQKELADVKAAATKAKADKEITDKADREKKAEAARKEREAEREKEQAAEYAEIAANYPAWEKELREKYAEVGLSEAEMADLIIRDRARRVRLLPRKKRSYKGNPTSNLEKMPTITPGPSTGGQIVTSAGEQTGASSAESLVAGYDPALHPKGKDGKWIEKLGLVDVFGLSGFQHGQRGHKQVQGQVVEIVPNPKSPGDPVIRVKMTDPRWDPAKFGETVDVKRSQVAQRVKPKGKLEPKAPPVDIAKPSGIQLDTTGGIPPARTATPNLTPHPDGPNLAPAVLPGDWSTMDNPARLAWVKDRLDTDMTAWRGEPTTSDFTGMDAGIAFNLANTYRDLVNWDPDTARRIDHPILSSAAGSGGLSANAIAVAHPGTAHPGGIGEKTKPSSIVFGVKYTTSMKFWQKQQAASNASKTPFSTSSMTGDPTVTLVHEFGHHRQFRYLDVAMRDAGKGWSDVVREDGFGLIPDTSNWPETQELRYQIPKLSQTKYGQSKSSEGFAEGIAERALGISSPELDATFDAWDEYMALMTQFPADRHWDSRNFDELTAAEKDQFWKQNGQYLDLPGMRDHYPDSAAAYDAWSAGTQQPVAAPVAVNGADGSPISAGQRVDLAGDIYTVTATKMSPKAYKGGEFDSPEGAGPIPQQGMVKLQSAQGSDMGWYLADAVTPVKAKPGWQLPAADWDEDTAAMLPEGLSIEPDPDTGSLQVYGPPDEKGFFDVLGQIEAGGPMGNPEWYFVPSAGGPGSQIAIPKAIADTHDLSAVAAWLREKGYA